MKIIMKVFVLVLALSAPSAVQAQNSGVAKALETYDKAFRSKDVDTIRKLLADDIVLYEHSIRNIGVHDAFDNHLKPEILAFQDMTADFSDVKITPTENLALVTRQYKIQGKMKDKEITAAGNETMVWKKIGKDWKLAHIHYSHPCTR